MKWTEEKEILLLDEIILGENNVCINVSELSELLGFTESSVRNHLTKLRKEKFLPSVNEEQSKNPYHEPYSASEKRFIIRAYKAGLKIADIANHMDRSYKAVVGTIDRLKHASELSNRCYMWTNDEVALLMKLIKTDKNGCVDNYSEIADQLDIPLPSIMSKVYKLRAIGKLPYATGNSIKGTQAYKQSIKRLYVRRAKERLA